MRSSPTISIFSERPAPTQKPYTFMASMLLHCVVIFLVLFGILSSPTVKTPDLDRADVRHLDLHALDPEMQRAEKDAVDALHAHAKDSQHPGGKPVTHPPSMRQIAQTRTGPQTLVQPDLPKPITLQKPIPLPTVVIWNGHQTPKVVLAPTPAKPPVADVKPSIHPPTPAVTLADISMAPSLRPALDQQILPTTTAPIVVQGPKPTPPTPITTTQSAAQQTATSILSLSNMRMVEGNVTLPPANETAALNANGDLAPGVAKPPEQNGQGNPKSSGSGKGKGTGAKGTSKTPAAEGANQDNGSANLGNRPSATHLSLPITGQFAAVVVGSSMEEQYPETASLWRGRLGYTVYLHVGTAESWTLQYSLPLTGNAAGSGDIAQIAPPWPYNIVRPNIDPTTVSADAIIIHGFVNAQGRFESLSLVFPPQCPEAQFILGSLAQWQFRPATQNGRNIRVEVVLIIPEEQQ